jgi:hypothetical protein
VLNSLTLYLIQHKYFFQVKGFHFTAKAYQENSYHLEDIFSNWTITNLRNKSRFEVTEVKSIYRGNCIVICPLEELTIDGYIALKLKTGNEIEISAFPRGEQFWLLMPELPVSFAFSVITKPISDEYFGASVAISECHTTFYSKKNRECVEYEQSDSHTECIRSSIWSNVRYRFG